MLELALGPSGTDFQFGEVSISDNHDNRDNRDNSVLPKMSRDGYVD